MPTRPPLPEVSDPRTLRAIAHPLRLRIIDELSATGPARAADLAQDLHIPANQASFHLRQLAKYGVVAEAPEQARDRRDRVWRLVDEEGFNINYRQLAHDPRTAAASAVWRRTAEGRAQRFVRAAFDTHRIREGELHTLADATLRLTDEEARQLRDDLLDVVAAWSERTKGRGPGRHTYAQMTVLVPYPEPSQE